MTSTIYELQNTQKSKSVQYRKLLWVTPLAILASSVANLILYFVAGVIFPAVTAWPGASAAQIIGANSVYLLFGALILAIVAKVSSQPARHFRLVASIGLVLSMFLPFSAALGYSAPGAAAPDTITAIVLGLMHVVSYAISVPMFTRLVLGSK